MTDKKNSCKVSLCVIALNEQENIGDLFANIESQTYDHAMTEIVLVDSGSTDNTKQMMFEFQQQHDDFFGIQVVDNPKRIQASGWNVAIKHAQGELIIRVDAHAVIPDDFVAENVRCIESGEDVCGGRRVNIIKGNSKTKRILLMAENSMFGSGIATYRSSDKKQYVRTVAHACYKREVFEKAGLFNESLLRSEDNEMHYRIRQNGYQICMSDKIHSEYQTRQSLKGMLKQKWGNGLWIGITSVKLNPSIFSVYHFVPLLFALGIIATTVLALIGIAFPVQALYFAIPSIAMWGLYVLLLSAISAISAWKEKLPIAMFVMPIIVFLLHLSYGVGTLIGIFKGIGVKITDKNN